jgi:hypothetical protein
VRVCDQLCNKILNAKFQKEKYFVNEIETLIKRKTIMWQPNPENPLFRRQN